MFVNYKNTLTMKVNKLIGKGMIALGHALWLCQYRHSKIND